MTKRKLFLGTVFLSILLGCMAYLYLYQEHRNIQEEDALFNTTSLELIKEYQSNVETTSAKYLDKIIKIEGMVTDVEKDNFTMDHIILCYTDSITIRRVEIGAPLKVKGRSIGYDELLETIKIDFTTITSN